MSTNPKQSASQLAYEWIRDAILTGTYEPGTMLGEVALATEIGVSRTPVRTALALLQDEGWVTLYPKRGALVQGLTERAVADLVDARFILESTSVQRASPATRARLVGQLETLIAVQRTDLENRDLRAFIDSTIRFHRSFVEVGENQVLLELYNRLADRQRYLLFKLGDTLLDRSADIIAEHEVLVKALLQTDAAQFSEVMREHLSNTSGRPLQPLCIPQQ